MIYSILANHNNSGKTMGEILFHLEIDTCGLYPTEQIWEDIEVMEEDGNIFSRFNEKNHKTEWFIYK